MKLSVVIISYNEKQYLSDAIKSCLAQNFDGSFEIIIGDDGSSDGSIELITEFAAQYPDTITWFTMERLDAVDVIPSLRVSNVLKKAFSIAKGEYLTVMSGDDLLCDRNKFSRQIGFLEENSGYSSCYTDYKQFDDDGKEQNVLMRSSRNNAAFWSKCYMHISCFLFRRNALDYVLERFCDDTGLILSILKSGKAKHLAGVMFGYRQRDGSIMHETDVLEQNILELLLLQDVLNQKGYYFSSLSRFCRPLFRVYKNRNCLMSKKYSKYFLNGRNYENDYLGQLKNLDQMGFWGKWKMYVFLAISRLSSCIFYCIRKVDVLKNILLHR